VRVAARASALSPVAHAVEDGGAVCGARPKGSWRLTKRLPVNCPTCLLRLSMPRFALCELPQARARSMRVHVRQLGERGFKPRGGPDTLTICGQQPAWDTGIVRSRSELGGSEVCARCRNGFPARLDAANAVR